MSDDGLHLDWLLGVPETTAARSDDDVQDALERIVRALLDEQLAELAFVQRCEP